MTATAPRSSAQPTGQRRQWDKALARAWPDGDLSSLLFFERTLPHRRKQTLQAVFRGRELLERLTVVLDAEPSTLPPGASITDAPRHRGLPVDIDGERVLVVVEDGLTLCATVADDEVVAVLLDGPLPFSDRQVRYRPRSELEGAEALAAVCAPFDLRFLRKPASRVDDRFACPPDLQAGAMLAGVLDDAVAGGTRRADIDAAYADCLQEEGDLIATWTVRRELIALLQSAARWTTSAGTLELDGLVVEHDGDVLRLTSSVTGAALAAPLELLDEGVLSLVARGWDGREHTLTITDGRATGPLPPLDALRDLAVELDDLEAQLLAIT